MGVPSPAPAPGRRIALFCLVLAVAFLFYPVLLGEGLFYFRDVSLNHYPTRLYSTAVLRSGSFPLWNPYLSGGMPLAADPNNLILHPVTLLFLALPLPVAFAASVLLQYLLAAWALFRLGEEEGLAREAALLAALAFAFSGPLVSCGSLHNLLSSWAWVPPALWALSRHARTRSRSSLLAYAALLAVQLLAGDPVAFSTTVLVGLLLRATSVSSDRPLVGRMIPVLGGALLAVGFALAGILPAREMLSVSGRAGGIPLHDALTWSVPPVRLLELFIPSLYGDPTTLQPSTYWGGLVFQKGYPFLLSLYVGIVPLLFCAGAASGAGKRRAAWLTGFTLLAALASLGAAGGIYPLLYRSVPLVSSLRYPSRFMLAFSLGISLLAGMGMDRSLRAWKDKDRDATTQKLLLALSAMTCLLLLPAALVEPLDRRLLQEGLGIPASIGEGALAQAAASLRFSFLRAALPAGALALLLLLVRRGSLPPARAGSLVVLFVACDLIFAHGHINPVVPATFYEAHPPAADLVDRAQIEQRVYAAPRPPGFAVLAGSNEAWWGYYWDEVSCRVATCLPWKIPMAFDRSTDLLSPAAVNRLAESIENLDAGALKRLADLASVGLIQSYRDLEDPGLALVGRLTKQTNVPLRLYRNTNPLPRAYWVGRALPEGGPEPAVLLSATWDPRTSVMLAGIAGPVGEETGEGSVEWMRRDAERLELRVDSKSAGWVVVTDNDYPGWLAEVDGKRTEIRRANHFFRAVQVPAGEHHLRLAYAPNSWRLGCAGTMLALAGAGVWLRFGKAAARP